MDTLVLRLSSAGGQGESTNTWRKTTTMAARRSCACRGRQDSMAYDVVVQHVVVYVLYRRHI